MRNVKIKIISILIMLLIFSAPMVSYATGAVPPAEETGGPGGTEFQWNPLWPEGPEIQCEAGVVMDYDSGTIVYEKGSTDLNYPASITKVMTALVAIENSALDEVVTFSYDAVHGIEPGSSSISRDVGEEMTMEECLYGLLLESANECGNGIAEHVAGSVEAFAEMMNKKAEELGCVNTHFSNPHGLHSDDHYTCAYDMALISREAYNNPTFALITGTKGYTIPPTNKHSDPTPLNNHHAMLNYYRTNKYIYDYCVGGKTGYTSKAGSTLVTYAKKDGMTLICVVMRGPTNAQYEDTRILFDTFFNNMQSISVSDLDERITSVSAEGISRLMGGDEIPFEIDDQASIFLPVGADLSLITSTYSARTESESSKVFGTMEFSYGGRAIGTADIIGRDVEAFQFKNITGEIIEGDEPATGSDFVVINVFRIAGIVLAAILSILLIRFIILRTGHAVYSAQRRRFENRDPHKDMRRIKRTRDRRSKRR